MNCTFHDQALKYAFGSCGESEKAVIKNHLENCGKCRDMVNDILSAEAMLPERHWPIVSRKLSGRIIKAMPYARKRKKHVISLKNPVLAYRHPAFQAAFIIIIFISGMLFQRKLADSNFNQNRILNDQSVEVIRDNQFLHNYLLDAQVLLLDYANISGKRLTQEEWEFQIYITRQTLETTRLVKAQITNGNAPLIRLINEIEWVLEDVIYSDQIQPADKAKNAMESINKNHLLSKIRGYII